MPLVPRSRALVSPPVCLERWKFRSSLSRCSKTLQATRRIAFWATFAKTAFLSSWNIAALILVTPSDETLVHLLWGDMDNHTCNDH